MNSVENCNNETANGFPCLVKAQKILHLISSKWGIQLIYILANKEKIRFSELRDQLQKGWKKDKISDATLSARLREFKNEGLIEKEIFPELPPRVEYSLTDKGKSLSKNIKPLVEWTIEICHQESNSH